MLRQRLVESLAKDLEPVVRAIVSKSIRVRRCAAGEVAAWEQFSRHGVCAKDSGRERGKWLRELVRKFRESRGVTPHDLLVRTTIKCNHTNVTWTRQAATMP